MEDELPFMMRGAVETVDAAVVKRGKNGGLADGDESGPGFIGSANNGRESAKEITT